MQIYINLYTTVSYVVLLGLTLYSNYVHGLSLASYYGDHMVLQAAPKRSQIWGYADKLGDTVSVQIGTNTTVYTTQVIRHDDLGKNIWKILLPAVGGPGPYIIRISSSEGKVIVNDVMFGDVWVCSGQSNMQFTLDMVFNASEEVEDAKNYPDIRLFTVAQKWSSTLLYELEEVLQNWTRPSKDAVGHSNWSYFSAVCWLYGKYLYQQIKRPLGLVATDWGGTPIEAWSSIQAMNRCGQRIEDNPYVGPAPQNTPTQLWKAMVNPLLNMTIYGVLWYQGEANAGAPNSYQCRFPAMIDDWRAKFNDGTDGQTDRSFPFGFVQLAPWRDNSSITTGFPDIRWHQTCNYGYVPNTDMPSTFMAVAIDLPDFTSPYNSIHPRDKQDVAHRLLLSGLQVAYNVTSLGRYQTPQVTAFYIDIGYHTLRLELGHGKESIVLTEGVTGGFEVCCSKNNQSNCEGSDSQWIPAPIDPAASDNTSTSIKSCVDLYTMGVRYAWRESPCQFKKCAVYTLENSLPMAPFKIIGLIGHDGVSASSCRA